MHVCVCVCACVRTCVPVNVSVDVAVYVYGRGFGLWSQCDAIIAMTPSTHCYQCRMQVNPHCTCYSNALFS